MNRKHTPGKKNVIEARHLTKRYRNTTAVDEVSFVVQPGRVTGFLAPMGGQSTTMRMVLGLDTPSSGEVRVDGKLYAQLADPLRSVGALLDAKAIVGSRSAANHLKWLADSNGIDRPGLARSSIPLGSAMSPPSGWHLLTGHEPAPRHRGCPARRPRHRDVRRRSMASTPTGSSGSVTS